MGRDANCALCGATPFAWPDNDESVLTHDELSWLANVRILGENPDSSFVSKVYITGPAHYQDYGYFSFERGRDPRVPVNEDGNIRTYDMSGSDPFAVPLHVHCLALFRHYLVPHKVDNEVLYETLASIGLNETEDCLALDYGPVEDLQEQCSRGEKGTEYIVSPFLSIPWLNQFYAAIKDQVATKPVDRIRTASSSGTSDPFESLPVEVILLVLSHLDMKAVYRARIASKCLAEIELGHAYWQHRILKDMPWLFDFQVIYSMSNLDSLDWTSIYRQLMLGSDPQYADHVGGLANRRRIWRICGQIFQIYTTKEKIARAYAPTSYVLRNAVSTQTALLVVPEPRDCTSVQIGLVREYYELYLESSILSVFWTADGALSGFGVHKSGTRSPSPLRDDLTIPQDDWLMGFVMYSEGKPTEDASRLSRYVHGLRVLFAKQGNVDLRETTGDQRLIMVTARHVAVGLVCHVSQDKVLVKLSLLQKHIWELCDSIRQEVKVQKASSYSEQAGKYLWRDRIPSLSFKVSDFNHGYWSHDLRLDASPMESIVLGESEDDLADLVAIGVDVHFGGFEVQYGSRPPRFAGPRRHAMQFLQIDGRGGERVKCMYWSVSHIPYSVRFVTNRGRQLVIGHPGTEKRYPMPEESRITLAGCFGYWSKRDSVQANLEGIGGLYLQDRDIPPEDDPEDFGSHGHRWCPQPLPSNLAESGTVWGSCSVYDKRTRREKTYPPDNSTVCWLDCQAPLQSIKVTLCHGTRSQRIQLVAMTFEYAASAEGSSSKQMSFGPTVFAKPQDAEGSNGHHWCWCAFGSKRPEEVEAGPHHRHETWQVHEQRLRSLRVWLGEDKELIGMQFVAADGTESPVWGYCNGDFTASIQFMTAEPANEDEARAKGDIAAGLKFFIGDNERQVTRNDSVVVAVQQIVQSS